MKVSTAAFHQKIQSAPKHFMIMGALFAVYCLTARLGLALATINHTASPVWPATGFAIFALAKFGWRCWPAILAGAFASNLITGTPLPAVMLISVGNTFEAIAGAVLYQKFIHRSETLEHHAELVAVGSASLFAPLISATVGSAALLGAGILTLANFGTVWMTWWIGDALGGLVVIPALTRIRPFSKLQKLISKKRKTLIFLTSLFFSTAASIAIFYTRESGPYLFAIFPLLLGIALISGEIGVTIHTAIICSISIVFTSYGTGPFHNQTLNDNLVHLQLFLGTLAITAMMLIGFKKTETLRIAAPILLVGWLITGAIHSSFYTHALEVDQQHLKNIAFQAKNAILTRFKEDEAVLRSGVALFAASENVTAAEWKNFVNAIDLDTLYPGISGFGVVLSVPKSQFASFTKKSHQNLNKLTIHPLQGVDEAERPPTSDGYIITYLEPLSRNAAALGLDLASETKRKTAADAARDSGSTEITDTISLVQDKQKRPGFLIYLPFYAKGASPQSLAERRKLHVGWIHAPFVSELFFSGALQDSTFNQIHYAVYDASSGQPLAHSTASEHLQDSDPTTSAKADRVTANFSLGHKAFHLIIERSHDFSSVSDSISSWVSAFGAILALLTAAMISSLYMLRKRAESMVQVKTATLLRTQETLFQTEQLSHTGSFSRSYMSNAAYFSPETCRIFDLNIEDPKLDQDDYLKKIHPEDRDLVRAKLLDSSSRAGTIDYEARLLLPGNLLKHIRVGIRPDVNPEGNVIGIIGSVQDITTQKLSEHLLTEQRQKMVTSAKLASLGEMAAGVAHEINNPLAIISGKASLLKDQIQTEKFDPNQAINALEKIENTVQRIAKIIKGLRAFSRNSEQDPFQPTPLNVIVQNTIDLCGERFKSQGVTFRVSELPESAIYCREVQLSQVLLNLLNNSFDAIAGKTNPWIELNVIERSDHMILTVTDCGDRISPAIADKIMQPFFTTKETGKGTGLGLSISAGIIAEHGGTLTLDRECAHTRFIIHLPLKASKNTEQLASD